MAFNYTAFRELAERLIEENGRTITLVRQDQDNPTDPAKPWRSSTPEDEVTVDVLGVFTEYDKEVVDGEIIKRGDKLVWVAAKSVEDELTGTQNVKIEDYDAIRDGTVRWKIVEANLIEPGDQRIVYAVQVRQ